MGKDGFSGVQGWFGRDSGVNIDLRRGSPAFGVNIDETQIGGNILFGGSGAKFHRYVQRPAERIEQAWERRSGPWDPDGAGGFRDMSRRVGNVWDDTIGRLFGGGRKRDYYEDNRPPERGSNFQYNTDPRLDDRKYSPQADPGPEFQKRPVQGGGRPGGIDAGADLSPLTVNQQTLNALDNFQAKINDSNGAGKLSDRDLYTRVSQAWTNEKPAAQKMFDNSGFAPSRAGLNEFINFTREAEMNPGLLSLHQQMHNNPALAREIADQWKRDVGADAGNPSYKGGKQTILDRLSEATNDPAKFSEMLKAKTLADLQKAMGEQPAQNLSAAPTAAPVVNKGEQPILQKGSAPEIDAQSAALLKAAAPPTVKPVNMGEQPIQRRVPEGGDVKLVDIPASSVPQSQVVLKGAQGGSTGTVTVTGNDIDGAKFTPAAQAPVPGLPYASNTPMTTKMLNEMSAKGILPEARVRGMGDDTANLLVDRSGKIVGGYTSDAQGVTGNFLSRDDLSTRLAGAGKNIDKMESDIQLAKGTGMKMPEQLADAAPALTGPKTDTKPAPKPFDASGGLSA